MSKSVSSFDRHGERDWDIGFTRIWRDIQPQVDVCMLELKRRFQAIGLSCADFETQTRQTPRGQSTFLSVVGWRGLLFIVDITLLDGMRVARRPGAALHVRLLDACGETVENRSASPIGIPDAFRRTVGEVVQTAALPVAMNSVYLTAVCHFDLSDGVALSPGIPIGRSRGDRDSVPDQ